MKACAWMCVAAAGVLGLWAPVLGGPPLTPDVQGPSADTQPSGPRVTPVVRVYRKVSPAVVNISTKLTVRMTPGLFREFDPFEDFLPDLFAGTVEATSLGSGLLLHPDGYIITNAHVVRQAQKIDVRLSDQSTFPAAVVAANSEHDLAVLRIVREDQRAFPFLRLGRSDDLMIGETVIAIGNPFGYENTCTTGIISSLDRTLQFPGGSTYRGLIQTDAPINPGNSGGPLLNVNGDLVGITTAIRAGAQGIGFAIPSDTLAADLPALLDYERLNRIVVGMTVRQRHGQAGDELAVAAVQPDSPAAAAGLKPADRLTAVNGKPLVQVPDYQVAMLSVKPGATVRLEYLRDGQTGRAEVKVVAKPKPDGAALALRLLGMELRQITADAARQMGLAVEGGMLVTGVERDGPADRLGVRRNDVLVQLGRFQTLDMEQVGAVLEDVQPGQVLRIGIVRGRTYAWANIQTRSVDVNARPPTTGPT